MTLKRLAEMSGVSQRTITTYENRDVAEPTGDVVRRLADALGVPEGFFERDDIEIVKSEAASFRKLSKTSATVRDAVLGSAAIAVEFMEVIAGEFDLPEVDLPSYEMHTPHGAAERARIRWQLGDRPISNMVHLLESKGVRIFALPHEYKGVDAFCFQRDGVPFVFLNTTKSGERQRFDMAHELGHLLLHSDSEMSPSDSRVKEAEANAFAAAFLMPESGVRAQGLRESSLSRLFAARTYWKVSAMAMAHRLHELELLNDWQYRTFCVELTQRGYRSGEPDGMATELSSLWRKVLFGADRYSISSVARQLDLYPADVSPFVQRLVPVVTV